MSASDIAQAAINVVSDPCLGDIAGLLNRLHALESDPNAPSTPVTPSLGIGLCKVVTPLKTVVYLRENPILGVAAVVGFLGVFVGIGYKIGKGRTFSKLSGLGDPWHDYFAQGVDDANKGTNSEPSNRYRQAYRSGHAYAMSRKAGGRRVIDV